MKMTKKHTLWIIAFIVSIGFSNAQNQLAVSSYYLNGFAINPAYSAQGNDIFLSFLSSQNIGSESSPGLDYMGFAGYGNLGNGLAAGLRTNYQKLGNVGYTGVDLSLSYRLDFDRDHYVGFSVSTGLEREKMDLAGTAYSPYVDKNDPLLQGGDVFFDKTRIALGAGALYSFQSLEVGLYFPHLMYGENSIQGFFIATAKYIYNDQSSSGVKIGNYALFRNQADGSNFYDGGLLVGFNDIVWVNAAYRSTNELSTGFYVNFDQIQAGYNHNANFGEFKDLISGRHELSVILKSNEKLKKLSKNRWHKGRR